MGGQARNHRPREGGGQRLAVPRLHAGRRRALPCDPEGAGQELRADAAAQPHRRRHRRLGRAGAGQHRPRGGHAGHGGQVRAVQGIRGRGRVPALHPLERRGRDRPHRLAHQRLVRRHQSGGHRRAPLLRDRAQAQGGLRHPRIPRRPARHRHLRGRGAAQRAQGRQKGHPLHPLRHQRRGRGRDRHRRAASPPRRARPDPLR